MKKKEPYIGVTGFMSLQEVVACDKAFCEAVLRIGNDVFRHLNFMVGVLISSKTLAGGTNKYPNRYPPITSVPGIISMSHHGYLLHTIHYNTDDPATIDEQIDQVIRIASESIDAIQLNIRWVTPVKLQRVRRKYPHLRIILQIGAGALADVAEPGEIFLGQALQSYRGVVDDFLVDPSGGAGKELDVWHAFACIADDEIPSDMQPGIAGGFHSGNVEKSAGLMRRLKRPVNLDAEGRLRTSDDHLHVPEAQDYIRKGVPVIGAAMNKG